MIDNDGCAWGWAADPDTPSQPINVHFYVDGATGKDHFVASVPANSTIHDSLRRNAPNGEHGFAFHIPYEFRDGKTHSLYAYAIDSSGGYNPQLSGSPKPFRIVHRVFPSADKLWITPHPYPSLDFKKLFTEPDKWRDARSSVSVLKVYDQYFNPQDNTINHRMDDGELRHALTELRDWGVSLALESGAVKTWGRTADVTYGATKIALERVRSLGGQVKFIAMDEPLFYGTQKPPEGCGYDMEKTLDETIAFIRRIKTFDPDIIVGDIEPWPRHEKDELKRWIIRFREKAGHELPFFHLDVDYNAVKAWNKTIQDIRELQSFCRSRGIRFGVIIWCNTPPVNSDRDFYVGSFNWAAIVHTIGPIDDVIIQSWLPFPKYNLPDSGGFSFTQLVRDYVRKYPPLHARGATPMAVPNPRPQ